MKYDVAVLGAGMVGVSCAFHLQSRGKSVILIDKGAPGGETSFGNAGIIQREAVEPYEFPRNPAFLLQAASNRRLDVRYHAAALARMAGPLFAYFRNSAPLRYAAITREYASIIALSLDTHSQLIKDAKAEALIGSQGYLTLLSTEKEMHDSFTRADSLGEFGVSHRKLTAAELAEEEPAVNPGFLGAIHWTDPVTIRSPGDLVKAYARLFQERGGNLAMGDAMSLKKRDSTSWQLNLNDGQSVSAGEVVVALGPWSTALTRRFGYAPPMFFKRGYHMHYAPVPGRTLNHWMIHAEKGFVLCPMQQGIRLTTGAELASIGAPSTPSQLERAEHIARRDFAIGARLDSEPWMGYRPCMADMKPVFGQVPSVDGMWCAFGHGHQGFTLGPATGELLTDLMTGQPARIDITPFAPNRSFG